MSLCSPCLASPTRLRLAGLVALALLCGAGPAQAYQATDSSPPATLRDRIEAAAEKAGASITTPPTMPVGMSGEVKGVVLPGAELEAKPQTDRRDPIVLRVVQSYPHGTAFRYDLEYYGLEAGSYDLSKWLQRKDGRPVGELPPTPVVIVAKLPAGQILPHELGARSLPWLGGYRVAVAVGLVIWLAVMWLILNSGRSRKPIQAVKPPAPATLADRLRPLVEQGAKGTLSPGQCAELERTLITYWTRKLRLTGAPPQELYSHLRASPQAGPLLLQLEAWLHQRPGSTAPIDVEKLLQPYRALPPDALDEPALAGSTGGRLT